MIDGYICKKTGKLSVFLAPVLRLTLQSQKVQPVTGQQEK